MNLTEMIARVRQDLHDEEAANYRWTDLVLTRHIARAVKEYSEALPLPATASLATTAGSREVPLAALTGRVMVEAVEYPTGQYPPCYPRFAVWGDVLTLHSENVPDGANCTVYYGRLHTLDSETSTIPESHEELVSGGACGYAAEELALYCINRVNNGGENTPTQLLEWGCNKLKLFRAELKRLGRRNKVRLSSLYVPHIPAQSKTTDPGPG